MAQWWRIHLPMQEMQISCLGREDPLEEGIEAHSSILAWEIPSTEEPGGLQPIVSQRVRHNWVTERAVLTHTLAGVSYHQVSHDWMNNSKKHSESKHIFLFEYNIKLSCKHPYFSILFLNNLALHLSFLILLENC